jgi:hypothetical protein
MAGLIEGMASLKRQESNQIQQPEKLTPDDTDYTDLN